MEIKNIEISNFLNYLTKREWDVLVHLSNDHSNIEISNLMCVSIDTIRKYRIRIGEKLGIHGRGNLERFARRNEAMLAQKYIQYFL